jgi:hypothetical protein
VAISPLAPRLTTEAFGDDGAVLGAAGAVGPGHRGRDDGGAGCDREWGARFAEGPGAGSRAGAVRGVPRAVTRANAAEEEAMSALEGSGVAMEIASESSSRARVPAAVG